MGNPFLSKYISANFLVGLYPSWSYIYGASCPKIFLAYLLSKMDSLESSPFSKNRNRQLSAPLPAYNSYLPLLITAFEEASAASIYLFAEGSPLYFSQVPSYKATLALKASAAPEVIRPMSALDKSALSGKSFLASSKSLSIRSTVCACVARGANNSGSPASKTFVISGTPP